MASSGNLSTSNGYIVYWIESWINSQDVNNNTSNIQVKVWVKRTNEGYTTYGTGTVYLNVDGQTRSSGISNTQTITSTPRLIHDEAYTINHNNDGSKTINISSYISHSQFSSSWQGFNYTLTTIPRASGISLSSNNVNAGTQINVTISPASSNFKHNYHLVFGGGVYSFGSNVAGGTYTVTIPNDTMNKIPNSTSGTGTIYCDTYNGSTKLGTSGAGITINVPSNIVPSFDSLGLERVDANGVPSSWGVYVKGKSKVKYSIWGANGSYGSSVTNYRVTGCGGTWVNWQDTTGELWATGTQTFTATITDSRGRTATKTNSITIYDYWSPTITSLSLYRCNSNGSSNDEGTSITVNAGFNNASVGGYNDNYRGMRVRWKKKSDASYGEWTGIEGNKNVIINGNFSTNDTYDFEINFYDYFTNTSRFTNIPTAKVTMDFRVGGNGVAIGKVSERDGFEVDMPTYLNKGFTVNEATQFNGTINGYTIGGTNAKSRNNIVTVMGDGVSEIGRILDFHYDDTESEDYNIRMEYKTDGQVYLGGSPIWSNNNCTMGTGTNQQWWRFDNGLQIVRQWKILGTINISNAWGSLFTQGSAQTGFDPYAVLFKSAPQTAFSAHGDGTIFVLNAQKSTTSWCGSYELARGASVTGLTNVVVQCISIGEWK